MTKEKRTEGLNLSYEGMLWAQFLMDAATSKRDQKIARAMYEAFWCLFEILTDDAKKIKKTEVENREKDNSNNVDSCDAALLCDPACAGAFAERPGPETIKQFAEHVF